VGGRARHGESGETMESFKGPPPRTAALSMPARVAVALAIGAVAVGALFHLGMVFLHVAPSNTLSKDHTAAVSDYIYPEFEQNWKLFAPDPLQQNIHVQARAEVRKADGSLSTTGWRDLTGQDVAAMRHNPVPSHTQQNELRRAWTYYTDNHSDQAESGTVSPTDLSRIYLQRIVQKRFGSRIDGGKVVRVQVRSAITPVPQPDVIGPNTGNQTAYRELSWWPVITSAGQENAS
jgi:hypothetical protein